MRKCPPCLGTGKLWAVYPQPCTLCKGEGLIADVKPGAVLCHWCQGNGRQNRILTQLCEWCGGRGYRPQLEGEGDESLPSVFFVEAGKPRTAHVTMLSVLTSLEGELRICDPYFGTGTLLRLDPIAGKAIRFLTQQPDRNEQNSGILPRALTEFVREHPSVAFKQHRPNDLHDRFVLSSTELILLGHGLKDIGNKDSFVVRLNRDAAGDTIDEVTASFDRKWAGAVALP
jgi:hypothetical protein